MSLYQVRALQNEAKMGLHWANCQATGWDKRSKVEAE